jgi:hypothetical protein
VRGVILALGDRRRERDRGRRHGKRGDGAKGRHRALEALFKSRMAHITILHMRPVRHFSVQLRCKT